MNQFLSLPRWAAAAVIVPVLVLAGCDVGSVNEGIETADIAVLLAADEQVEQQPNPTPISSYPHFDVSVEQGVSVSVYARETPNAVANVFLVHGAGGGAWVWEYFFDNLPASYNLYALSWRGHFDSSPVEDARSADYVKDQHAVMASIARRNALPVHVVGHSYGGATATLQVAEKPGGVASLTLLAPVVPIEYTSSQATFIPLLAPMFIDNGNDPAGTYGGMFMSQARMQRYHDLYAGKDYSIEKPSLIAGDGISVPWQETLGNAYKATAAANVPTSVVIARYDNVVLPQRQQDTARQIGADVYQLESGHYLPLDAQVFDVIDLVTSLLRR